MLVFVKQGVEVEPRQQAFIGQCTFDRPSSLGWRRQRSAPA